jgi:hypothetical protein
MSTVTELLQEQHLLRQYYQACLNVRKESYYKTFSESTLRHEALAFARMVKRGAELQELIAKGDQ